jgi:hypothetical protein
MDTVVSWATPNPREAGMESNTVILAIDLEKFHSVYCWCDSKSKQAEFRKVATTPDSFREILIRNRVTRGVIEACSQAEWVSVLCLELGL